MKRFKVQTVTWGALVLSTLIYMGCDKGRQVMKGAEATPPEQAAIDQVEAEKVSAENRKPKPTQGNVSITLTYHITTDTVAIPGNRVSLHLYERRRSQPGLDQGDFWAFTTWPGEYTREAATDVRLDYTLANIPTGELVYLQGIMCVETVFGCEPAGYDSNYVPCSTEVLIRKNLKPSCQPVFTWGSDGLCQAECR